MSDRLSVLYDSYEDKLYRLARRLCRSAQDAHDLVQNTFLRAAQAVSSIPNGAAEYAWLVRVLVNLRRDEWRKAAVRTRAAPLVVPALEAVPPTAESILITKRAVWSALDALSPHRRAIVVLAEIDGVPPHEIARLLGVAVMTVRWHLSMARRELKRTLAEHLGERHEDAIEYPARRRSPAR